MAYTCPMMKMYEDAERAYLHWPVVPRGACLESNPTDL